jgi:hypothetical protein
LGSHLHNGWPEYANTTFKSTEAKKLNAPGEWETTTSRFGRKCKKLFHSNQVKYCRIVWDVNYSTKEWRESILEK